MPQSRENQTRSLCVKIAVTLEDEENNSSLTLIGTRHIYQRSLTHQVFSFAFQLLNEMLMKAMHLYINYYHTGKFSNEVINFSHAQLRQQSNKRRT